MKKKTLKSKILSGMLALSMLAGLLPLSAFAEDTVVQSKTITGFAAVEGITVAVGESEPTLPQSVSATVRTVSTTTAEDGSEAEQTTVADEPVPVTWALDVAFSSAAAGEAFTYTAALPSDGIYSLDAGVSLPTLTVTVAESEPSEAPTPAEISAFETVDAIEVPKGTAADALGLPAEISATVNGAAGTAVAVSWAAEGTAYSQDAEEDETFAYKAALQNEAAYTLVNDASLPTLTVRVVAAAAAQDKVISAFVEPDVIEIAIGDERTEAEITDSFPDAVSATVNGTAGESVPVTEWSLVFTSTADGVFSTSAQGEFYYEPTLAAGYTLSGEAILPSQKVQVGEALSHGPALASLTGSDFVVTGDASNYTWNDTNKVLTITGNGDLEISMAPGVSSPTTDTIVVQNDGTEANAANITLNGVNIDVSGTNDACAFEIANSATANITLLGTNTLKSGLFKAGLQVQTSGANTATLNILDAPSGSLTATGGFQGAGIGGSNAAGGNINIQGGTVTATAGSNSAGIGGGLDGAGGNIDISGGNVTATGNSGAGIGGGQNGAGGNIDISGGNVTATGNSGAGIGGGQNGAGGTINISGTAVITKAQGGNFSAGIGGSYNTGGNITISGSAEITLAQGGSGGAGIGGGHRGAGGNITISGSAEITLAQGGSGGAGIGGGHGGAGGEVKISGGSVTATGGNRGAGIGGGYQGAGGDIDISGGTVSATGEGAGIGSGSNGGDGGNITISGTAVITKAQGGTSSAGIGGSSGAGGIITISGSAEITLAQGGEFGAGIGGGVNNAGGTITIKDSAVITLAQGGDYSAGIGGSVSGAGGTIKIEGGTVKAVGSKGAAGIGSGGQHSSSQAALEGGNITISGGTVVAVGSEVGAGIGGGGNLAADDAFATAAAAGGAGGTINISGGNVTATGGTLGGAGIGGGATTASVAKGGAGGTITISGGNVTATGGNGASGIGGAARGDSGTFSTGAGGSAYIVASSIADNDDTSGWSGVIFGGDANDPNTGTFYSLTSFTLATNSEVPEDKTLVIPDGKTFIIGAGKTLTNKGTIFKIGTLTETGTLTNQGTILPQDDLSDPTFSVATTSVFLKEDGATMQYSFNNSDWYTYTGTVTLTGTTDTNTVTVLSGTHDVALKDANIDASGAAFDIQGSSVVNLTLLGSNTMQSGTGKAGLQVPNGATLNITENSSGSLHATGGSSAMDISGAAGIGGGNSVGGGTVTISGGTVVAEGNFGGAGIGGGLNGAGGTVKITGGSVTATANDGGTGIGVGQGGSTGDTIEIMGGTVTAMGSGGARALSATPTYTLPNPSAGQFYSVSIRAGATEGTATPRTLSEDYVLVPNYVKIAMSSATPTIGITPNPALTYNGTQQTQIVAVKLGSATLTPGTYTLSGNTATNAGDYTLTVTVPPLGANSVYDTTAGTNYIGGGGTQTATYTIQRATLTITGATAQSRAYNGITDATADVSFSGLLNGETLTKGTDYTVSADFPSPDVGDNLTVGGVVQLTNTAKASNYIFNTAEFSFPTAAGITPLSLAGAQVALGTPIVANGTEQTQSVASITLGGRTLTEGIDYTVSGNTATNAGGYTLTITGKGNYMGTLAVPFTVVGTAGEALPYEPTGTLDKGNSTVPNGNTLHITSQSDAKQQQDLAKLREYAQQHGITGVVNFLEDITMTDAAGNEAQPQNGNTRLRINVPGLTTADTVTVLHIKDDGSVEEIQPVDVHNGYVEFYPTSFSVYSVIVHKAGTGVTSALSPQTGVY